MRINAPNGYRVPVTDVPVPQAYLASISSGQVQFAVPAYPSRNFEGKIPRISNSVDEKTRTIPVELDVANRNGLLTPGTYAQVPWPIQRTGLSLAVPRTAIELRPETAITAVRDDNK